jgi:hypothetical protein
MPIEIKELVIRTVVGREAPPESLRDHESRAAASTETSTEEIVQECVRQVMRALRYNKER